MLCSLIAQYKLTHIEGRMLVGRLPENSILLAHLATTGPTLVRSSQLLTQTRMHPNNNLRRRKTFQRDTLCMLMPLQRAEKRETKASRPLLLFGVRLLQVPTRLRSTLLSPFMPCTQGQHMFKHAVLQQSNLPNAINAATGAGHSSQAGTHKSLTRVPSFELSLL